MATYNELFDLFSDDGLRNRCEVAVIIAVEALTDTPANNAFVAQAYTNTRGVAEQALMAVLASNNGLTVNQIQNASDAALQSAVDSVVATLVKASAGL